MGYSFLSNTIVAKQSSSLPVLLYFISLRRVIAYLMKKTSKTYIDLAVRIGGELKDAKSAFLKVNSVLIKRIARCVVEELRLGDTELSICLTDDAGIRELNSQYRGKDKATDVLSFPMEEDELGCEGFGDAGARVLGDVAISVETARRQAESYGVTFYEEMARLLTHGILHLIGFDHVNGGRQAALMKREEEHLLKVVAHIYSS